MFAFKAAIVVLVLFVARVLRDHRSFANAVLLGGRDTDAAVAASVRGLPRHRGLVEQAGDSTNRRFPSGQFSFLLRRLGGRCLT